MRTGRLAPVCHPYIVRLYLHTGTVASPSTGQAATSMMTGTAHGLYRLRRTALYLLPVAHLVQIYKLQCQNCDLHHPPSDR